MKPIDAFLSRLNPLVPGCPEPAAFQALRDAAIAFCEDAHVLQIYLDPITTVEGGRRYDLDLPTDTALARVLAAWHCRAPLVLLPGREAHWVDAETDDATGAPVRGTPSHAYLLDTQTIYVYPPPAAQATGALTLKVALKPTRTASQVDDALLDDWAEPIVHGAAARLAATPGVSYSSGDMVAFCAAQYAMGLSRARLEARKGRIAGGMRAHGWPLAQGSGVWP